MKKLLLILLANGMSLLATAQVVVTGISPSSIAGNYVHSLGETSQSWGLTLNFNNAGVHVQGVLALVEDGTPGTNAQGNPISQEGCNPLTNATDIEGKIAVIYRNTCDFGVKAKNAENAGAIAVIILNRDPEAVGMSGGAVGATVEIPVVMLSSIDGVLLTNAMEDGDVEMFIGNKAGLNPVDLGLSHQQIVMPSYPGVHKLLAQNADEFSFTPGLRVYNYGSDAQVGATANVKIVGPAGEVYNETKTFDLTGVSGNSMDSITFFPNTGSAFPTFSLASYPVGLYSVTYTLASVGGTDPFIEDNSYTTSFAINDNYISRAHLQASTYKPNVTSLTRPSDPAEGEAPYAEVVYCQTFSNPNASRIAITGIEGAISIDSVDASSSLLGKFVFVDIFKWTNASEVYNANLGGSNLEYVYPSVSSNLVDITETGLRSDQFFPLEEPTVLEDNAMYLICLTDFGQKLNIGMDRDVDFNVASSLTSQWINPLKVVQSNEAAWYRLGFGHDITPAFGIKAIDAGAVGIKEMKNLEGKVYPNPVSDEINMVIPLDGKATIEVTDISGRVVASHGVDFLNNQASVNVADLANGMFIINVIYDNGAKTTFNVIKK